MGKHLYFAGSNVQTGKELWRSDGTAKGTGVFVDIRKGKQSSSPYGMTVFNGKLLFSADDGSKGREPWVSDGTQAGTKILVDIKQSIFSPSSNPVEFTAASNALYFRVPGGSATSGIWRTDGSSAGTVRIATPNTMPTTQMGHLAAVGNRLFFSASTAALGSELYVTSIAKPGPSLVADLNPGSLSTSFHILTAGPANKLVFSASAFLVGKAMWATDGTQAGTLLLGINQPPAGSTAGAEIENLRDVNGTLYFDARGNGSARDPWRSDGTTAGTTRLKAFPVAPRSGESREFTALGDEVFFTAKVGNNTRDLFKTDGTAKGTVQLTKMPSGSSSADLWGLTVAGRFLYFTGPSSNGALVLWRSDGTSQGTVRVPGIPGSFNPFPQLMPVGNRLYFAAGTSQTGAELWVTDGTRAGTRMVKDIYAGPTGTRPYLLGCIDGRLYFAAITAAAGPELWISDGTPSGTNLAVDLTKGPNGSDYRSFTPMDGYALFATTRPLIGLELWRTDGTPSGTYLVKDINPTTNKSSSPNFMVRSGSKAFFTASDPVNGRQYWVSDGTANGTVRVTNFVRPQQMSTPIPVGGGSAWLPVQLAGETTNSLWKTGGTLATTRRVVDATRLGFKSIESRAVLSNGNLFFVGDDGVKGRELWTIDPGASSKPHGIGCSSSRGPQLRASRPVLARLWTLSLRSFAGKTGGMLLLGLPKAKHLGLGCTLYVDLATQPIPLLFSTNNAGQFGLSLTVPNTASLKGVRISIQAGVGPTTTLIGVDLTNGVLISVGT